VQKKQRPFVTIGEAQASRSSITIDCRLIAIPIEESAYSKVYT
jgi:hypothetical protein